VHLLAPLIIYDDCETTEINTYTNIESVEQIQGLLDRLKIKLKRNFIEIK